MSGTTQFAVLQKEFGALSAEHLKRAFSTFAHLTDADAVRLANSSRGILMRQLNRDSARAFQRAFSSQGVETAVVEDHELPRLPDPKSLHRVEFSAEALVIFDLLGRATPIAWQKIGLVAAAEIVRFEFVRTEFERSTIRFDAITGLSVKKVMEPSHKTDWEQQLMLEIVLADGSARYQIEAKGFPFKYVIDRPDLSLTDKYIWLVREIFRNAPHAMLNHGARSVCSGSTVVPRYESRQMMADEMVWLLWHAVQQTRTTSSP